MTDKAILGTIQYVPDLARGERINIGVVLHFPTKEYLKIEFIKNKSRLKHFDDELDIDFYNLYTSSIKDEFTPSLTNPLPLSKSSLLKNLSYNYVNQFQFSFEDVVVSSDLPTDFENFKKFKLHYYLEKDERLSNKEKLNLLSNKFLNKGFKVSTVKRNEIAGLFDESINFDFKIANSYIKIFEFNEVNYKFLVNQIKIWVFNSRNLNKNINMFFVIEDNVQNNTTNSLYNALKESNKNYVFKGFEDPNLLMHIKNISNQ